MEAELVLTNGTAFANPYTYTGRRYDPETELYYFRARYYDAKRVAGFISRDPFGYVDGMSLYQAYFVPRSVDPFGLFGDPLPKKCKVPPDDCFTLIEKMGRFADDFA